MSRPGIIAGKTIIVVDIQNKVAAGLRKVQMQLNRFSNQMSSLGLDLSLFGGATSGGLAFGLRAFQTYEDSILFLRTKVKGTDKDFQGLEQTIRMLGSTTSFTAQEVAEGAVALGQAGFSINEIESSLQAMLDLARGARIEISTASMIMANTIRTFGLNARDSSEIASKFIAAARNGTLDVVNLSESLKEVSGSFRDLNVDLDTSLTLITALSSRNLRGTKAGTSINTALLQLARKRDEIKKIFDFDIADRQGNLKDPLMVLEELMKKMKQLGGVQKAALLGDLFNIRGKRAIGPLAEMAEFKEIESVLSRLRTEIREAQNEARDSAIKMDSGFGGAMRRATSAAQELNLVVQSIIADALTPFIEKSVGFFNGLSHWAKQNKQLVLTLAVIPPLTLLLGTALLTLSFLFARLTPLVALFSSGLALAFASIKNMVGAPMILLNRGLTQTIASLRAIDLLLGRLNPDRISRGKNKGKPKPTSFFNKALYADIPKTFSNIFLKMHKARNYNTLFLGYKIRMRGLVKTTTTSLIHMATSWNKYWDQKTGFRVRGLARVRMEVSKLSVMIGYLVGNLSLVYATGGLSDLLGPSKEGMTGRTILVRLVNQIRAVVQATEFWIKTQKVGFKFFKAQAYGKYLKSLTTMQRTYLSLVKTIMIVNRFLAAKTSPFGVNPKSKEIRQFLALVERLRKSLTGLRKVQVFAFFMDLNKVFRQIRNTLSSGSLSFTKVGIILNNMSKRNYAASIGKAMKTVSTILTSGMKGLFTVGRSLGRIFNLTNAIRLTISLASALKNVATILLSVTGGVTRFIFSWNGMWFILDMLLLFGHRIKFVRDMMNMLGSGFNKFFEVLGNLDVSRQFRGIGAGFDNIMNGNIDLGMSQLQESFGLLITATFQQISQAWNSFWLEVVPVLDFFKTTFASIEAIVEFIGDVMSAVFSQFGGIFKGMTGAELPVQDLIKDSLAAFADVTAALAASLTQLFFQILQVMIGLAQSFLGVIGSIQNLELRLREFFVGMSEAPLLPEAMRRAFLDMGVKEAGDLTNYIDLRKQREKFLADLQQGMLGKGSNAVGKIFTAASKFKDNIEKAFAIDSRPALENSIKEGAKGIAETMRQAGMSNKKFFLMTEFQEAFQATKDKLGEWTVAMGRGLQTAKDFLDKANENFIKDVAQNQFDFSNFSAAVVGSYQNTRGTLLKRQDPVEKSNELLEQIRDAVKDGAMW